MESKKCIKERALSALGYFDKLDKNQLETAVRLAVFRQYKPLETIFNEDKGLLTYVHFVVSGECMILQCLRMKVTAKKGKRKIIQLDIIEKGKDDLFFKIEDVDLMKITKKRIFTLYRKNNEICGQHFSKSKRKSKFSYQEEHDGKEEVDEEIISNDKTKNNFHIQEMNREFEKENEKVIQSHTVDDKPLLKPESIDVDMDSNTKIENHFIDVGSITFGGIFGLGEDIEHRVIMARTTVQCILLPRFWLFEKVNNPGGIWDRRRFYIECNIPSRQELFENFLTTRKWQKFKNDLIESNLENALKTNNPTKFEDIPIICRIVEANNY